jgi:GH43 family beta-xylosidase
MGLSVQRARAGRWLGFVWMPMLAAALLIASPAPAAARGASASHRPDSRARAASVKPGIPAAKSFTNPLGHGQDPSIVTFGGWYYLTQSSRKATSITVRRSQSIKTLGRAAQNVVWRGGDAGSPCCEWWGPELHLIGNEWYIYAAADDGADIDHRLQVLASSSPLGPYTYQGTLATPGGFWSIDPSPLSVPGGSLLMFWSGWPGTTSGLQNIYVAAMSNPWTISGGRTQLSTPTYSWERHLQPPHVSVNESPEPIIHGSTISVSYSASGCATPNYSLGLLSAHLGSNLLSASSWTKAHQPIFASNPVARIFGPASNGWFLSPDGRQTWVALTASTYSGGNCGPPRYIYVEPVKWNRNGTPNLGGKPLPATHRFTIPSGDLGLPRARPQRHRRQIVSRR